MSSLRQNLVISENWALACDRNVHVFGCYMKPATSKKEKKHGCIIRKCHQVLGHKLNATSTILSRALPDGAV